LRALNQQLTASEAQSRSLAKFPGENPSPVLRIAKDGIVTYANQAGEKLLAAWKTGIGKYLRDNRRKFVTEVFNSAESKETEFEYENRTYSLTFVPVPDADYVNVYGLDITERKRAERTLQLSEARYRELFGHMSSCVAVYEAVDDGADFVFRDFNAAAEKVESISKDKLLGKRITEVFPGVKEFGLLDVFRKVWKTGRPTHHPVTFYKDERISGWRENYVYKLPSEEIVAVYDDVTKRKRAEQALQAAHDELEQRVKERTAELAEVNEQLRDEMDRREQFEQREREHQAQLAHYSRLSTLGEMTSGLAHELNQPLCAIANYAKGSLRLMKSGSWDSHELLDAMEGMADQAERAGEIIRHIRDLVRKRESHRTTINVSDVVAEAIGLVQAEARLKGIKIRQVKSGENISPVLADPIQIEQILVNLLRNGFEAMADTAEDKRRITVEVSAAEDGVAVAVSDTGKGVPHEIVHKVFESFFTTKPEGLGMGLSISRSIIEAHGGRISILGNSAAGATFKFTLPLKGGP